MAENYNYNVKIGITNEELITNVDDHLEYLYEQNEAQEQAIGVAQQTANDALELAQGKIKSKTYNTIEDMIADLKTLPNTAFKVGDVLYVIDEGVPDFWITEVKATSSTSNTLETLEAANYTVVQFGYYVISKLETQKTDLTGVVKTEAEALTDNTVILGAGEQDVKASTYTISNDSANESATTLPTNASVKGYVGGVKSALEVEIGKKVTAVAGFGLSSNDYTTAEKTKLAGIDNSLVGVTANDIGKVKDVKVNGTSVLDSSTGVANLTITDLTAEYTESTASSVTLNSKTYYAISVAKTLPSIEVYNSSYHKIITQPIVSGNNVYYCVGTTAPTTNKFYVKKLTGGGVSTGGGSGTGGGTGSGLPELPPTLDYIKVGDTIDTIYFDTSKNVDEWLAGLTFDWSGKIIISGDNSADRFDTRGIDIGSYVGGTAGTMGYAIVIDNATNIIYVSADTPSAVLQQFGIANTGWQRDSYALGDNYTIRYIEQGCDFAKAYAERDYLLQLNAGGTINWLPKSEVGGVGKPSGVRGEIFNDYSDRAYDEDGDATAGNVASGEYSHAEGYLTTASGNHSHAEGYGTTASDYACHAEGYRTTASYDSSHAEGGYTTASSKFSHAEGHQTTASGEYTHAEGSYTTAIGTSAHAEGHHCEARGDYSHAGGYFTRADRYQTTIGRYTNGYDGPTGPTDIGINGTLFIIGNGTSDTARGNAFRVSVAGLVYGAGAYNTSGADYAEYFEWADGNPNNEDRRGHFVTLDGDKIRYATNTDDYILGVISTDASVAGDVYSDEWHNRYLKDVYGEKIVEEVEVAETTDEAGNIIPAHTAKQWILNPNYNPEKPYVSRENRPEWSPVGLMGKLVLIDDGTCTVNGFCKVAKDGTATASTSRSDWRVLKRLDETHILILFR